LGYIEHGMLFCKGRNDDQVKLRGYRIELNEITAKIDAIPFVAKAETIALKRNNEVKKIVSLVQLNEDEKRDYKQAILNELAANLPDYMIPSDIKIISAIPLNQNGKADKQRLTQIYLGQDS
jgi:D-alanine--poly(phosphoribitol) ligase subunit 1